jgi:hypothetical protein
MLADNPPRIRTAFFVFLKKNIVQNDLLLLVCSSSSAVGTPSADDSTIHRFFRFLVPHLSLSGPSAPQAYGTPRLHPKSKPFVDRVMSFFVLDNRVWIRTYQITWREPGKIGKDSETTLTEVR